MFERDIENLKAQIKTLHENDEKQLDVIFTDAPRVIVEAPAGYGKTTTMISRIAYLYASGLIPNPKRVLGLTFSVNAALKIKRDVAEKLPILIGASNDPTVISEKITVTNYHGFCKSVLRKYGYLITPQLRKDVNLFKAIGDGDILDFHELKSLVSPEELRCLQGTDNIIKQGEMPAVELIRQYIEIIVDKLLPLDFITHNAIILMVIDIFSQHSQIQSFYQNYYPLIIVDEFQDTNSIAWALLKSVICEKSQLLFLGDPLQRIYGFIGALPNIMTVAANEYGMQQITLDKNYRFRSNPDMLLLDHNIRANAAYRFFYNPGESVANLPVLWGTTQEDEAAQIAQKIRSIQAEIPNAKIAVLCRARGQNAEVIENALSEFGISYFYGLFNEEDDAYIEFHRACQELFIQRFSNRKYISSRSLTTFVDGISRKYLCSENKVERALLTLLSALVEKVSTDYATINPEDKYTLLLDMFENCQLKQAMEYVDANIVITTIHGAKGLEWEYVFLSDVERWVFPSFASCNLCPNRFSSGLGCKCFMPTPISPALNNALLEELSVFYVGITRARKQIYMSASAKRYNYEGSSKGSMFSCFSTLGGIRLTRA